MPQFLRLASFALAFVLGVAVTYPLSWLRQECSDNALAQQNHHQLPFVGNRVRHARPAAHNLSRGHVEALSLSGLNTLYIAVRWEVAPDNGAPGVRWYNYAAYQKYIVEEISPPCGF